MWTFFNPNSSVPPQTAKFYPIPIPVPIEIIYFLTLTSLLSVRKTLLLTIDSINIIINMKKYYKF